MTTITTNNLEAVVKFEGVLAGVNCPYLEMDLNENDILVMADGYDIFKNQAQFLTVTLSDNSKANIKLETVSLVNSKDGAKFHAYGSLKIDDSFESLEARFNGAKVDDFNISTPNFESESGADLSEVTANNIKIELDFFA